MERELKDPAELLRDVVTAMVDAPDEVQVSDVRSEGKDYVVLTLRTSPADIGKVIGKGGRVVNSLRMMLHCVG
ncbi:MAG: KH domain-containing protein, partial [Terriglobus sp.]